MTPQQATADQATTEVMQHFVANISGLELREKIKQTIIKAMECRAPAPTEPAVDRDAVGEPWLDTLRELVSDFRKAAFEFGKGLDPDDHALMMERQGQIFAHAHALATPASPAVPEQPVAWFEADPSAKGLPLREVIGGMVHSTRFHSTKPEVLNNALWPLYEHPAPQVAQASQPTHDPKGGMDVDDVIRELGVEDEVARIRAEQFSQPTSAEGKGSERLEGGV